MKPNSTLPVAWQRANTALIQYPRFKELHEEIELCQRMSELAGEPQCMSLEGRTGTGKTTVAKTYADSFPVVEDEHGRHMQVLYMEMPSPVGIRDVASEALRQLGDPACEKGTRAGLTIRLSGLIRDCGIRLVILDDFHHLIDKKTNHILAEVSDWLKVLIKETKAAFLVVGMEGYVELILDANPQLSRLFAARETLQPFVWTPEAPETIQEFGHFIEFAEQAVEMPLAKEVPRTELLYRLHYATEGVVGYIMNLMRFAMLQADRRGSATIDLSALSVAFSKRLAKHLKGKVNPFAQPTDSRFVAPSPSPAAASSGKRGKPRELKASEVLKT